MLFSDFHPEQDSGIPSKDYENLFRQIQEDPRIVRRHNTRRLRYFRKIAAVAAAVLLVCGMVYWNYQYKESSSAIVQQSIPVPGGSKAQIVLADGSILNLETLQNDTLVQLEGYAIHKGANGEVTYRMDESSDAKQVVYNTIITPKGGEYKLLLSDGTRIAINAMSSLRYPIQFHGDKREVELLSGEAYFEVNKVKSNDTRLPFIVKTKGQILTVLGTVFNINTYSPEIITTLV